MERSTVWWHGVVAAALLAVAATAITTVGAIERSPNRLEDDGVLDSGKDAHHHHDNEQQHGEEVGHLDPRNDNIDVVGITDLFGDEEQPGRIADVSAKGNYAYLTHYYEPTCSRGGVQIVDISDPTRPTAGPFIPSHTGTFSGEGSQVISISTSSFTGDVLVYQNEVCPGFEN
ncbi:MAG: hypothetical protein Q8K58_07250, partial [Acidimicrobiales bacterium]|nr:hypothetical protein [Acidimicrobiales bacterium]